jgi:tetratricopeptide (TPR) repeat protein
VTSFAEEGDELYKQGQYDKAIGFYDKAIEIDPKNSELRNSRGLAICHLGLHIEALVTFEIALEIDPGFIDAWNNMGVVLFKLKRYDEAIRYFDKIIKMDPRGFLFTTFEGYFLKNVLCNHPIDIYFPLKRSHFWSFFDSFR